MVPASLGGKFVVRFCVCAERAQDRDVILAIETIRQTANVVLGSPLSFCSDRAPLRFAGEVGSLEVPGPLPTKPSIAEEDEASTSDARKQSKTLAQKRGFFVRMVSGGARSRRPDRACNRTL